MLRAVVAALASSVVNSVLFATALLISSGTMSFTPLLFPSVKVLSESVIVANGSSGFAPLVQSLVLSFRYQVCEPTT